MTPDVEFARMLHAAEQLSAERALIFTYDQTGWRVHPAAFYDPFENAPPIEAVDALERSRHESVPEPIRRVNVKPCGTPAAYRRHKNHGEDPCDACRKAYRAQQIHRHRDRAKKCGTDEQPVYGGSRRSEPQPTEYPRSFPQPMHVPVLTTPDGAPMLISVAGQGESVTQTVVDKPASYRVKTVADATDADAVPESEAS